MRVYKHCKDGFDLGRCLWFVNDEVPCFLPPQLPDLVRCEGGDAVADGEEAGEDVGTAEQPGVDQEADEAAGFGAEEDVAAKQK